MEVHDVIKEYLMNDVYGKHYVLNAQSYPITPFSIPFIHLSGLLSISCIA